MTDRKVRNRYHYFLKKVFGIDHQSEPEFEVEINVPFEVDELILRDVANAEATYEYREIEDGGSIAVVALPQQYVHTLHLDGVGPLCTFTHDCYTKVDNVFKVNGRTFNGLHRFRILNARGNRPAIGITFSSLFTAHLEFILYEK